MDDLSEHLFNVVKFSTLENVQISINPESNLLQKNRLGKTMLHEATLRGDLEIVEFLIHMGSNISEKTRSDGNTALHIASWWGNFEIVKLLVSKGANMLEKNNIGYTALHSASRRGHFNIVKFLVESCVEIDASIDDETNTGKTALDIAKTEEIKEFLTEQLKIQQHSYILK